MWLKNAGLKRKFLVSTIATVIVMALAGSALVLVLVRANPANLLMALIIVTIFYIAVGVTGILLITRIMVQPVVSLTAKVEEVRRGNLDTEIDVSALRDSGDELNQLMSGFAQMVRDLRSSIEALKHSKVQAEEYSAKLEQSNRRLNAMFDHLPDGVMIVDRSFRIVHVNPVIEKFMGRTLEQVRGEHCFEMCQGTERRCSFCRADTVFQLGGRASTFCTKPAFAGQEGRMLEIYDFPLFDEKGEVEHVIEYVKDVTDAVKMQQNLERAQRLAEIGNIATVVAHEVRNPLNAIRGAVHYLRGECTEENIVSYLRLMEEQVERVANVTSNLLDFAKPLVVEFQQQTIMPVIDQALAQVERQIRKKRVHLQKDIEAGLPMFPMDAAQVERAIINLLNNALESMSTGGNLCISARHAGGTEAATEIEVVIADDGPGIGNRDPDEFFKPFFTTKLQGTGLGLFIVRKIMESHQGKARLEPNDGRGTRAVLTFPTRLKVYETEARHFGYR